MEKQGHFPFGRMLLLVVLTAALAAPAAAVTVPLGVDELVASSSNVIRGEVTSHTSYWNDNRDFIYTIVTVRIEEQILGRLDASHEIEVWLPGGEVDDTGLKVEHAAELELGQDVILFLSADKDYYDITGWEQGKYTVVSNRVLEKNVTVQQFTDEIKAAQR